MAGMNGDVRNYTAFGPNLATVFDPTAGVYKQFSVHVTGTQELIVGQRVYKGLWTSRQLSGPERTPLNLPADGDDHNFFTIGIDHNGIIWIFGNMHAGGFGVDYTMLGVKSAAAYSIGAADTGFVDAFAGSAGMQGYTGPTNDSAGWTYPHQIRMLDGTLLLCMRQGVAGLGNQYLFKIPATGASTWQQVGSAFIVGAGNFYPPTPSTHRAETSPYTCYPFVSADGPNPAGRLHLAWIWRTLTSGAGSSDNYKPSYAYSDDIGVTWKAIDGSAVTLPITVNNNLPTWTGITVWNPDGGGFLNPPRMCLDALGRPHIFVNEWQFAFNPDGTQYATGADDSHVNHIYWNGSSWVWEECGSARLGGQQCNGAYATPVLFDGKLCLIGESVTGAPPPGNKSLRLFDMSTNPGTHQPFPTSPVLSTTMNITTKIDPEALRIFGDLQTLIADNVTPIVYGFDGPPLPPPVTGGSQLTAQLITPSFVTSSPNSGPTVVSNDTHQFAVSLIDGGTAFAHKRTLGTDIWATTDLSTIAGNPLGLPAVADPSARVAPSIGVDSEGRVYIAVNNITGDTMHIVKSGVGGDITTWTNAASEFTSPQYAPEYINFVQFSNGGLGMFWRRRFQHYLIPVPADMHGFSYFSYKPPGTSRVFGHTLFAQGETGTHNAFNLSGIYVDAFDQLHVFGCWDLQMEGTASTGDHNIGEHSYLFSDDYGGTWYSIQGQPLGLPINRLGTDGVACRTGITMGSAQTPDSLNDTNNLSYNSATVDSNGYPCCIFEAATTSQGHSVGKHIVRWNGTAWVDDASSIRQLYATGEHLLNFRGKLHVIAQRSDSDRPPRRLLVRDLESPTTQVFYVGHRTCSAWFPHYDSVALMDRKTLDIFMPDSSQGPHVYSIGRGWR